MSNYSVNSEEDIDNFMEEMMLENLTPVHKKRNSIFEVENCEDDVHNVVKSSHSISMSYCSKTQ